jgi:hypothetical protein
MGRITGVQQLTHLPFLQKGGLKDDFPGLTFNYNSNLHFPSGWECKQAAPCPDDIELSQ